jgi:GNAT superfamily N-acetyltransferase
MRANPVCRELALGSEDYRRALELRETVLRKPLGLVWTPEELAKEAHSFHLGCFEGGALAGTLVLTPLDAATIKMRLVAVAGDAQGRGIGTALVTFAEEFAAVRGFSRIVAHARETALPFYCKLGYLIEGEPFIQVSIPHVAISKRLPTPS